MPISCFFWETFFSKRKRQFDSRTLFHLHYRERLAVEQGNFQVLDWDIPPGAEEFCTGEGGAHFEAAEAGRLCRVFTGFEEQRADAAASPRRVNEEGADFCGVPAGVEKIVLAVGPLVGAVERFALAPAAAADDERASGCFRGKR